MANQFTDKLFQLRNNDGNGFTVVFCDMNSEGGDTYLHVRLLEPEPSGNELLDEVNKQRTRCFFGNYLLGLFYADHGWMPYCVDGDWERGWRYLLNNRRAWSATV